VTTIYSEGYVLMCELLREFRERAGRSQSEVGAFMGLDQSRVSKFESGQLRLDIIQLRSYCHAIGVSMVEFVAELERRLGGS
jgi:transcriptional regulator with XRE-family HTH domain